MFPCVRVYLRLRVCKQRNKIKNRDLFPCTNTHRIRTMTKQMRYVNWRIK